MREINSKSHGNMKETDAKIPSSIERAQEILRTRFPDELEDLLVAGRFGLRVANAFEESGPLLDWFQEQVPYRATPPIPKGETIWGLIPGGEPDPLIQKAQAVQGAIAEANRTGNRIRQWVSIWTAFFPRKFLQDPKAWLMLCAMWFRFMPFLRMFEKFMGGINGEVDELVARGQELIQTLEKWIPDGPYSEKAWERVFPLQARDFALISIAIGLEEPAATKEAWDKQLDRWRNRDSVTSYLEKAMIRFVELVDRARLKGLETGVAHAIAPGLIERRGIRPPQLTPEQNSALERLAERLKIKGGRFSFDEDSEPGTPGPAKPGPPGQ